MYGRKIEFYNFGAAIEKTLDLGIDRNLCSEVISGQAVCHKNTTDPQAVWYEDRSSEMNAGARPLNTSERNNRISSSLKDGFTIFQVCLKTTVRGLN